MRLFALASRAHRSIDPIWPNRLLALSWQVAALVLALAGMASAQAITIGTTSLPQGSVGALYQAGFSVSGGAPPYTWNATGSVPPGLTVFSSGIIQGIPTAAGNYTFVVSVTDRNQLSASKSFTVIITGPVLSISTTSPLPNASIGQAYSQTLVASNGTPPYTWIAGTGIPPGLSLGPSTGTISGTPSLVGSYTFSVSLTDSANNTASANFALTVTVQALTITTISPLFNGTVGVAYNQTLTASGGKAPYQWSVISGSTGGLTLDPNSGALQGTPQNTGTFTFTAQVSDSAGNTATQQFSLTVNTPTLTIITAGSLPPGAVGVSYSQKLPLSATGGTPPYTWSLTPTIPGLTFDPVNVALNGTPAAPGSFPLTVTVTDSTGQNTSNKSLTLVIAAAALGITTPRQLPDAALSSPYNVTVVASGGTPPFTWSAAGLPAGLGINSSTGVISGTPTAAGSFGIAITVSDSALAHYSDRFTLNVNLPPVPPVTFTGLSGTVTPATQYPLQISIDSPYPSDINGQAIISFTPNSGPGDGTIQFSTGGTTANFTIPAGSVTAPQLLMQTGTVAGVIVISLRFSAGGIDITPSPAPSVTGQIAPAAPVIKSVQVTRTSNSITLAVTGYSTALEVTQATYTFSAAAGQSLQSTASSISVDVTSLFSGWFQSSNSVQFGSQFVFTQPFNITGDPTAVIPGTVTLTNRVGTVTFTVPN
jgi:large repetitive protein